MTDKKPLAIIQKVSIRYQMFEDWIVTALEGGSNYWYLVKKRSIPQDIIDKHTLENNGDQVPFSILFAKAIWVDKATIDVHDVVTGQYLGYINMKSVKKAMENICEHHLTIFQSLMSEEYDANDADVFFQYAVIGELTFA